MKQPIRIVAACASTDVENWTAENASSISKALDDALRSAVSAASAAPAPQPEAVAYGA